MANEIRKLGGNGIHRDFLFLYPISPRFSYITQGSSTQDIAPTPSTELEAVYPLASPMLTTQEKNDLDTGDAGYEIVTIRLNDADLANDAVLIPLLQSEYASRLADFLYKVGMTYNRSGDRFNA